MTDEGPAFTFLALEDVLSLHEDAINTWGGTHGIRDRALLESAVGAARNVAIYDETADVFEVAAAYAAACLFVKGIDLADQEVDGESTLAKAMIDVAERRWPEPRRALADVLRRLSVPQ